MELDDFKFAYYKRWGVKAYINFFNESPPVRYGRPFVVVDNAKSDYDG